MRSILLICLGTLLVAGPALAQNPWYDRDWNHRVPFVVQESQIEGNETFTDFALLVLLDGARNVEVFQTAKPDGSDLLFTAGDGVTVLERQIVSFDPVAETAEIWVRANVLSKTENVFYMYYSNPTANLDPDPAAAWGPEYRVVYHFEEDPAGAVLVDSSPQGSDCALRVQAEWTSADVEDGAIGRAWSFNGTTHHLSTKSISTADSSFSISAWLRHEDSNTDFFFQAQPGFWHLAKYSNNNYPADPHLGLPAYAASGGPTIRWKPGVEEDGDYHHLLWSFDAINDTIKVYYDGGSLDIWGNFPPAPPHYTGRLINPDKSEWTGVIGPMFASVVEDYHDGGADEFRIREGVMSDERVLTEYRSQRDNFAFIGFGIEETLDVSVGVEERPGNSTTRISLRMHPNPSAGNSVIRYSLAEDGPVRLSVYDTAGREVARLVDRTMAAGTWTEAWNGRDRNGLQLAVGVYYLRLQTPSGVKSAKISLVR
jgi:hypothetical protein